MDDENERNNNPEIVNEQMSDSEFERQLEAAEERIRRIQDETTSIKRGMLKMWKELEELEKAKRQRALERHRDARNRLDRARTTSPIGHRASTSTDGRTQSQTTQQRNREKSPQRRKSTSIERQVKNQAEQHQSCKKSAQHRESASASSKSNKSKEKNTEIDRDRSPIDDRRSSSAESKKKERKASSTKEKKVGPVKEKVDRKALFSIKKIVHCIEKEEAGANLNPRSNQNQWLQAH